MSQIKRDLILKYDIHLYFLIKNSFLMIWIAFYNDFVSFKFSNIKKNLFQKHNWFLIFRGQDLFDINYFTGKIQVFVQQTNK